MGEGAIEIRDRTKGILSKLLDGDKTGKVSKILPSSILDKIKRSILDSPRKIEK